MRQTREQLETAAHYQSEQAAMLHTALADVMAGEHTMVGRFTLDGIKVLAYLVGASRADGGTLLVRQTCSGQTPSYSVFNLEREHECLRQRLGASDYVREMYNVTGNALILRNRICAGLAETVGA